jgi:oligopeptide transport system permease protein
MTMLPEITAEAYATGEIVSPPRTLYQDAALRLSRNRFAVGGLIVIVLLTLVAVFAPIVATHDPDATDFSPGAQYQGISADHWLGTDGAGRDWYSRLVYGTRTSLGIGVASQLIVLAIGVPFGLLAGYAGGRTDNVMMRFVDLVYAIPALLFILLIAQVMGTGVGTIIFAIGIVGWVDVARLLRGRALSLRHADFVTAATMLGASDARIMSRHLLPNSAGPVIVAVTFGIPAAIFAEAALSFIGVGLPAGTPSWGTMVSEGYDAIQGQEILVIAPAAAIAVTMLAFTFLGDGLRDALDPRTR